MRYLASSFLILEALPNTHATKLFDVPASVVPPDAAPWMDSETDLQVFGASLGRDLVKEMNETKAAVKAKADKLAADLKDTRKAQEAASGPISKEDKAHQDRQLDAQHERLTKLHLQVGDTIYIGLYSIPDEAPAPKKEPAKDKDGKDVAAVPPSPVAPPPIPVRWIQVTIQG